MAERVGIGAIGSEVARLHEELRRHGFEVPASEARREFFGPGTREAVLGCQAEHGLACSGEVDESTTALLSGSQPLEAGGAPATLRGRGEKSDRERDGAAANFRIQGQLIGESTRRPLAAFRIEAWDEQRRDQMLGRATTDDAGSFTIEVEPRLFKTLAERGGDVFFRVYRDDELVFEGREGGVWERLRVDSPVVLAIPRDGTPTGNGKVAPFRAEGHVTTESGVALPNVRVEVWDHNLDGARRIATSTTDPEGRYSVDYDVAALGGKARADLEIRIVDPRDEGVEIARSPVVYQASDVTAAELVVEAKDVRRPPEYDRLLEALQPLLGERRLADLDPDAVTYLADRSGWDARSVAMAAQAARLSGETKIPPAHYYALLRSGLGGDPATLHRIDDEQLKTNLEHAVELEIIGGDESIEATVRLHHDEATTVLRTAVPPGAVSSLGDMLGLRLDDAKQADFIEAYRSTGGDPAQLWPALGERGFDSQTIRELQTDGALGHLTLQNAPLVRRLISDVGISEPTDLAAAGLYRPERWNELIGDDVPEGLTADTYAGGLAAQVNLSYPTQVLADLVRSGEVGAGANGENSAVAAFLAENGVHKIGVQPVATWTSFEQLAPETRAAVKAVERMYQLSPSHESMVAVSKLGIDSAYQVMKYSPDQFLRAFGEQFPSESEAMLLYKKAHDVHSTTLSLATMYLAYRAAPNVYSLTGTTTKAAAAPATGVAATATLEELFQNMDYCACDHCKSVLSPAAYLVELLELIDLADVPHTKQNPLDVLLGRRPDLQHLLLSCENTNVAVPYIDLVNEILEFFIAHGSLSTYTGHNMTPSTMSADLLADPEFVEATAYDETAKKVYPYSLPFDMPLEGLRLQFEVWDSSLAQALGVLGDAAGARREHLALNGAERRTLTETAFKALPEYFGEPATASIDDLNNAVANAKRFCRRVDIHYDELIALLRTRFVNPDVGLVANLELLPLSLGQIQSRWDGALTDAELTELLPTDFDAAPFGGDVLAWLDDNRNEIVGLITLTDVSAAPAECSFADLELRFANPDMATNRLSPIAYHKLHRFIRLWKKLDWAIELVDEVVTTFVTPASSALTEANIDAAFVLLLDRIANFRRLLDCLSVSTKAIPDWLSLWDTAIDATARRQRLAKLLRIGTTDLDDLAEITGIDPLAQDLQVDEPSILRFIESWHAVKASPTKVADLNYLLRHKDTAGKLAPTDEGLLRDLRYLRTSLTAVDADLSVAAAHPELASARASMALIYDNAIVDQFFGLLGHTTTYAAPLLTTEDALPSGLSAAAAEIDLDPFKRVLSCTGPMSAATQTALDAAADALTLTDVDVITTQLDLDQFVAAFKAGVQAIRAAGEADLAALAVDYPELKAAYDALAGETEPVAQAAILLESILPDLRAALKASALRTTLANLLKVEGPVVDVLTRGASVLHANSNSSAVILTDFLALEEVLELHGEQTYELFVDPPATSDYILYVGAPATAQVTLTVAGTNVIPTGVVGASGEVRTAGTVKLEAGKLASLELTLAELPAGESATLRWRTKGMAKALIPGSLVYGKAPVDEAKSSLIRIQKAAVLQRLFELTPRELQHLAEVQPVTAGFLNDLDADGSITDTDLHALWTKTAWLIWFAGLKRDHEPDPDTLVNVLERPALTTLQGRLLLAGVMEWNETDLNDVLARLGLALADLSQLDKLRRVLEVLDLVAATLQPAADLIAWSVANPAAALVTELKDKVKARMDPAAWRETQKSVSDALRNKRRDALVAYILFHQRPAPEIATPDELYEHFLVDTEMDACMQTSRIRLALSTVQLFVNRCLMNLENDVAAASIRADQWQWMKRYRVWEANRKVFLFPENWLEPELRDNKSPLFRELESELLKADITDEAAEEAYLTYLKKLDDIAKLEIVGAYLHEQQPGNQDDDILHVFGRTIGTTRQYYYRRFEYGYWTPWEKMSLNLDGDLLLPVVWKGQLFVFWVTVVEKPESGNRSDTAWKMADQGWGSNARVTAELTFNWGEYYRGKWISPKSSEMKDPLRITGLSAFDRSKLVLAVRTEKPGPNLSERAVISVIYLDSGLSVFKVTFTSKNSAPIVETSSDNELFNDVNFFNYELFWSGQTQATLDSNSLVLFDRTLEVGVAQPMNAPVPSKSELVLTKTAQMLNGFRVRPVMHPVENQWEAPFFYTDEHSVFFVSADELVRSIAIREPGYYLDFVDVGVRDRIKKIPKIYEKPVIPKPGDPVIKPWVDVINTDYKTIITDNSTFEFGGVTFDARGRVEERSIQ